MLTMLMWATAVALLQAFLTLIWPKLFALKAGAVLSTILLDMLAGSIVGLLHALTENPQKTEGERP
jgi:hypothetical protein